MQHLRLCTHWIFTLLSSLSPPLPPNAHCTDIRVTCQTRSPRSSSTSSLKQRCQFNSKRKLLPSSAKPSACISPQLATINNGNYVNVSLKWPSGRMPEEKKKLKDVARKKKRWNVSAIHMVTTCVALHESRDMYACTTRSCTVQTFQYAPPAK